jgi:hypothetical protein
MVVTPQHTRPTTAIARIAVPYRQGQQFLVALLSAVRCGAVRRSPWIASDGRRDLIARCPGDSKSWLMSVDGRLGFPRTSSGVISVATECPLQLAVDVDTVVAPVAATCLSPANECETPLQSIPPINGARHFTALAPGMNAA